MNLVHKENSCKFYANRIGGFWIINGLTNITNLTLFYVFRSSNIRHLIYCEKTDIARYLFLLRIWSNIFSIMICITLCKRYFRIVHAYPVFIKSCLAIVKTEISIEEPAICKSLVCTKFRRKAILLFNLWPSHENSTLSIKLRCYTLDIGSGF